MGGTGPQRAKACRATVRLLAVNADEAALAGTDTVTLFSFSPQSPNDLQRVPKLVVLSVHIKHKLKADLAQRHPPAMPCFHYEIRSAALAATRC